MNAFTRRLDALEQYYRPQLPPTGGKRSDDLLPNSYESREETAEVDRILARCPALGITELEPMVRFLAAEMSLDAEEVLAEAKAIMEGRR